MSDIHSCSYYCTRAACVLAQRDELRAKLKQQAEPVVEPVALSWSPSPRKTVWGNDVVTADVEIDRDHTLSLYCESSQIEAVNAMFSEIETLRDSCAAKADRIDRLGEMVERLKQQAEPATSRPKQRDYASFVGYARALEAYCDALEKAKSVATEPIATVYQDAISASGRAVKVAYINGKAYKLDPRQSQWAEDRIRAVQAEPVVDKSLTNELRQVDKEQAEPSFVISPPAELKYVISLTRMAWDYAMAWAAGLGMRLATVEEMRGMDLPPDLYWSGTEHSQRFAWLFGTYIGSQQNFYGKSNALFAVAVAKRAEPVVELKEQK